MITRSAGRTAGALACLMLVPLAAQASALLLRPAQVWSAGEPLHGGWVVRPMRP